MLLNKGNYFIVNNLTKSINFFYIKDNIFLSIRNKYFLNVTFL